MIEVQPRAPSLSLAPFERKGGDFDYASLSIDHIEATAGVECRSDADVIDETPAAYKPLTAVMEAQKDLVAIMHTLRQVVCVKG